MSDGAETPEAEGGFEEGIDYSIFAVPKGGPKRDKKKGWRSGNSSLLTYKELAKVNEANAANARAEAFGRQAQACRDIGICCCCGEEGETEPHHYVSRGAGGTDEHCVPMKHAHHMRLHAIGSVTFWRGVRVDPAEIAFGMAEWVAAGCPRGQAPVQKKR